MRAEIIERLMCEFEVDATAVAVRHGADIDALSSAAAKLGELAADGVIEWDGDRIAVRERGLVRVVAAAFDAHLAASPRQFSRAV